MRITNQLHSCRFEYAPNSSSTVYELPNQVLDVCVCVTSQPSPQLSSSRFRRLLLLLSLRPILAASCTPRVFQRRPPFACQTDRSLYPKVTTERPGMLISIHTPVPGVWG